MAASTLLVSQQDNKLTPNGKNRNGFFFSMAILPMAGPKASCNLGSSLLTDLSKNR
jgi:hypothetical protein